MNRDTCHHMTPDGIECSACESDVRIAHALDLVLLASGSALKFYTMESTLTKMRDAMTDVMHESYTRGWNDCRDKALTKQADLSIAILMAYIEQLSLQLLAAHNTQVNGPSA